MFKYHYRKFSRNVKYGIDSFVCQRCGNAQVNEASKMSGRYQYYSINVTASMTKYCDECLLHLEDTNAAFALGCEAVVEDDYIPF